MAIKTHLADSEVPLVEGTTIKAKCEADVPSSAFVFMWDDSVFDLKDEKWAASAPVSICRLCKKQKLTGRYIYGIVSGEESKQAENI